MISKIPTPDILLKTNFYWYGIKNLPNKYQEVINRLRESYIIDVRLHIVKNLFVCI